MPTGIAVLYATLILGSSGSAELALAYSIAGLLSGVVGAWPSVIISLFSTDRLVSGISVSCNITYAIWASALPIALIALTRHMPWACVACSLFAGLLGLAAALRYGRRTYYGAWRLNCDIATTCGEPR